MTDIRDMRERLNAVSPAFCLAKWYQVTIHLQNGHTHSCHHPRTHKVPLSELSANPSALHNTQYKKERRKEMLEGHRPEECQYCWNVEDAPGDNLSDRHLKSNEWWSRDGFEAAQTMPWDSDVYPRYVEVSFGNVCNFKCAYCAPHISSKWMEEVKQHGPYPTSMPYNHLHWVERKGLMPIPEREHNPYVEAFWKWWPDLYKNLRVFRITGGEPLLTKNTFRVLQHVLDEPNPELSLSINSNLGVPSELYQKFLDMVSEIVARGCVKDFTLYTSVDAHGARAEYIRTGLNYDEWLKNADTYLTAVPAGRFTVMSTFNALSVTSFLQMYEDLIQLRLKHPWDQKRSRVTVDFPYLRHPEHMNAMILTPEYVEIMKHTTTYLKRHANALEWERMKIDRIYNMMREPWPDDRRAVLQADFYRHFSEHDRRRGTNFLTTFPEMEPFWAHCKALHETNIGL